MEFHRVSLTPQRTEEKQTTNPSVRHPERMVSLVQPEVPILELFPVETVGDGEEDEDVRLQQRKTTDQRASNCEKMEEELTLPDRDPSRTPMWKVVKTLGATVENRDSGPRSARRASERRKRKEDEPFNSLPRSLSQLAPTTTRSMVSSRPGM